MLTLMLGLTLLAVMAWLLLLSRSSSRAPPGLHLNSALAWQLAMGSLLGGTMLYLLLVMLLYERLVDHVAERAVPPDMAAWVALNPDHIQKNDAWSPAAAQWLLEELQIEQASPTTLGRLRTSLACKESTCSAFDGAALVSSVQATAALTVHTGEKDAPQDAVLQCTDDASCRQNTERAIARLLVGSLGCEEADAKALTDPSQACLSKPLALSAGWQPSRIASWLGLPCQSKDADPSSCQAATTLLQGALDDPQTRTRQIAFGMVYGFGRWLVLVLALAVAGALCWRRRVRRAIETQTAQIVIIVAAGQSASATNATRNAQANQAWQTVQAGTAAVQATVPPPHPATARPDPLREPVESLIYQACRSHPTQDATPVRDSARQSRHEMEGWWELLTTVVTVFPVIGLAATLNGLIHAFAQADRIAVAVGDARAGAIRTMVAELSASFSTTFVALLLMSFLTLWALRTKHAETRAFTRAEETVDEALVYR